MKQTVQGAQSFSRSINVLQLISDAETSPKLTQLLELSGLTRPTLYRILSSLEAEGLIEQTSDRRFKPGLRLVTLARRALADTEIRTLSRSALEKLCSDTGETVHLAIRSGNELVYIDKIESNQVVRMTSMIGTRVPFHSSGVGKAYLGALSENEAEALISELDLAQITSFTNTNPAKLITEVKKVHLQGYVFDNQENEEGIVCYGAAILDERGYPVAAVSISIPLFRHKKDDDFYVTPLKSHLATISEILGFSER